MENVDWVEYGNFVLIPLGVIFVVVFVVIAFRGHNIDADEEKPEVLFFREFWWMLFPLGASLIGGGIWFALATLD